MKSWVVCLALAGCTRAAAPVDAAPVSSAASAPSATSGATTIVLEWKAATLPEASIAVDMLSSIPVEHIAWPTGGGTLLQASSLDGSKRPSISITVRAEPTESMDLFRADHASWAFAAPTTVTACGQPAQLLVATRPPHEHEVLVTAGHGQNYTERVPASVAHAVFFRHKNLHVRITWEVESNNPSLANEVERHVLPTIRCL